VKERYHPERQRRTAQPQGVSAARSPGMGGAFQRVFSGGSSSLRAVLRTPRVAASVEEGMTARTRSTQGKREILGLPLGVPKRPGDFLLEIGEVRVVIATMTTHVDQTNERPSRT